MNATLSHKIQDAAPPAELTLVISDLGSGGAQRVLTTLANEWARSGRRICVITLADSDADFFSLDSSIIRIALGEMSQSQSSWQALRYNWRRLRSIRRAIRASGSPIVVGFVATTNILVVISCLGLKVRTVISERSDPARESLGFIWDHLRQYLYRFADVITANSQGALDTLARYTPRTKLAYVPNPLNAPDSMNLELSGQTTILSVGSLRRDKGHDLLLKAFALIASEHPNWTITIAGDGSLKEEYNLLADQLGISDRITWLGCLRDVYSLYSNASFFVLPSRREGMPNAMLEAMASGLPVIVTDASPGPLEFIEDGVNGLVAPTENIEALAQAMRRLIEDAALRRQLGEKAKDRVAGCELNRVLQTWEQVIGMESVAVERH